MDNTVWYGNEGTFRLLKILTTTFACIVLIASIVCLYFVQHMPTRLGLLAAFMVIFSFSLNITTSATTKDIFTATAA